MNLLVTGAWNCTEEQLNEIRRMGHAVQFLQYEKDDLPCDEGWVEGVICNGLFLYHPIERMTSLRYIQLTSAGFDRVPMDYVQAHGIEIHNARGVYSIPMAEFAVCSVLQLYKQSRFFSENQKLHKWEKCRSLCELAGKKVLIFGCGDVGKECAKRFRCFGCHVVGVDKYKPACDLFDDIFSTEEADSLIPKADAIILCVALTPETTHLFNADRLAKMKPTAVLVNISRGAVVDQGALEKAVDHIGGAVLDVFEEEPLHEDSPLWDKENVIITPHNSFVGENNAERLYAVILKHLEAFHEK